MRGRRRSDRRVLRQLQPACRWSCVGTSRGMRATRRCKARALLCLAPRSTTKVIRYLTGTAAGSCRSPRPPPGTPWARYSSGEGRRRWRSVVDGRVAGAGDEDREVRSHNEDRQKESHALPASRYGRAFCPQANFNSSKMDTRTRNSRWKAGMGSDQLWRHPGTKKLQPYKGRAQLVLRGDIVELVADVVQRIADGAPRKSGAQSANSVKAKQGVLLRAGAGVVFATPAVTRILQPTIIACQSIIWLSISYVPLLLGGPAGRQALFPLGRASSPVFTRGGPPSNGPNCSFQPERAATCALPDEYFGKLKRLNSFTSGHDQWW